MRHTTLPSKITRSNAEEAPKFLYHSSFESDSAPVIYGEDDAPADEFGSSFMPDEVTRQRSRNMHYAGYRLQQAVAREEKEYWRMRYFRLRDSIVVGNRKLAFRAVRRWPSLAHRSDDLVGECYLVLIRAVTVYNPWLGIRFSTYAYTCLMRALYRLSQRTLGDRFASSIPLDLVAESRADDQVSKQAPDENLQRLGDFFRDDHPLLSKREKTILMRRYCLDDCPDSHTLEKVGRELGLSKERVRQVQAAALDKLRRALTV